MTYRCDDCGRDNDLPGYCLTCLILHQTVSSIVLDGPSLPQYGLSPEPLTPMQGEYLQALARLREVTAELEQEIKWHQHRRTPAHRTEVRLALLRGEEDVDLEALNPEFYGG